MASLRARIGARNFQDPRVLSLLSKLKKSKSPFWKKVAWELSKPRRKRPAVNLNKLERLWKEGFTIVVPGKVLSFGKVTKPLRIAAFAFSKKAVEKIKAAGGEAVLLEEELSRNPEGKMTILVI